MSSDSASIEDTTIYGPQLPLCLVLAGPAAAVADLLDRISSVDRRVQLRGAYRSAQFGRDGDSIVLLEFRIHDSLSSIDDAVLGGAAPLYRYAWRDVEDLVSIGSRLLRSRAIAAAKRRKQERLEREASQMALEFASPIPRRKR